MANNRMQGCERERKSVCVQREEEGLCILMLGVVITDGLSIRNELMKRLVSLIQFYRRMFRR